MMLDITKLWDRTYLLGAPGSVLNRSDQIFFWLAIGLVVCSIVAKIIALYSEIEQPRRFLANRLFHACLTSGLLLLVWYGARLEQIPLLAVHFTVLLLLLILLIWAGFIAKYFWNRYREQERVWKEQKVKQKYLAH